MLNTFWYAVITVAIFFVMTQYVRPGLSEISAAVVTIAVITYLVLDANTSSMNYMAETDKKYADLSQSYDHLYVDTNLIYLLHSILDFKQYNPDAFNRMMRQINHGLTIVTDYTDRGATENCADQFQLVESYFARAMFYMDALWITLPPTKQMYHRHQAAKQRLQLLLKRQTDRLTCRSTTRIYEGPRPYEEHAYY